jgi:hypothetical protein
VAQLPPRTSSPSASPATESAPAVAQPRAASSVPPKSVTEACNQVAQRDSGANQTTKDKTIDIVKDAAVGAVGGAALGAVGGAIGGDAGKGAAIGAGTGALIGGIRRRESVRQQQYNEQQYQQHVATAQSSQSAAQAGRRDSYNRALAACLQGRGYTVS